MYTISASVLYFEHDDDDDDHVMCACFMKWEADERA
jgi:hypothetical protein